MELKFGRDLFKGVWSDGVMFVYDGGWLVSGVDGCLFVVFFGDLGIVSYGGWVWFGCGRYR